MPFNFGGFANCKMRHSNEHFELTHIVHQIIPFIKTLLYILGFWHAIIRSFYLGISLIDSRKFKFISCCRTSNVRLVSAMNICCMGFSLVMSPVHSYFLHSGLYAAQLHAVLFGMTKTCLMKTFGRSPWMNYLATLAPLTVLLFLFTLDILMRKYRHCIQG
jgi:hypothetical protein